RTRQRAAPDLVDAGHPLNAAAPELPFVIERALEPDFPSRPRRRLGFRPGPSHRSLAGAALLHPRGFPAEVPQIVQLRPTHASLANELDRLDGRRMQREDALHAHSARDLPHGEGLVDATVLAPDDHALEGLDTLLLAFTHAHVDADRVAGAEVGNVLLQEFPLSLDERMH